MHVDDYSYQLPDELIAVEPPKIRGASRLLVLDRANGSIIDDAYSNIDAHLQAGDVLVLNDSRVIKARLITTKSNGSTRELVILEKHGTDTDWHEHKVMYRRKLAAGDRLTIGDVALTVTEILGDGIAVVRSDRDLLAVAEQYGTVPLPPYMHRDATEADIERYQTVWAREAGSVAAPTASLNMTEDILDRLRHRGVMVVYVTLHVGMGTFMPIRTDDLSNHVMHQEYFEVPLDTAQVIAAAKAEGRRVVALGTTVARTLEYAAVDIMSNPRASITREADIFIYPGYEFRILDGLITNYHAPKSTVLMLTAAFAGWDNLLHAYNHAVDTQYRFLSYGDSMFIR